MLIVSCLLTFGFYTASYMRIPVVPLYARSLGAATSLVGIINAIFFMTAGCLSVPMGIVSDRLGREPTVTLGIFVAAVTSFLLVFTRTPYQIIPVYFLFGVGLSAYGPTMMSYVADVSPVTHLGRAYGWYTTSLYTGMSIGPAVGGFVADRFSYTAVFVFSGVVMIILCIFLLLFLPSLSTLKKPELPLKDCKSRFAPLRNRSLWACWLATLGLCSGLGMFITFVPLHARDRAIQLSSIGLIFMCQGVANAISRIPFGYWSDKTADRRRLVVGGIVLTSLSLAGIGFSKVLWHFVLAASALGLGLALAFTSVGALIAVVAPPEDRGLAMGGYNTCIYLGIMASSMAMGWVIEKTGYLTSFSLSAVTVLGAGVVFVLLFGRGTRVQIRSKPGKVMD